MPNGFNPSLDVSTKYVRPNYPMGTKPADGSAMKPRKVKRLQWTRAWTLVHNMPEIAKIPRKVRRLMWKSQPGAWVQRAWEVTSGI
jgi:hypothetical protein